MFIDVLTVLNREGPDTPFSTFSWIKNLAQCAKVSLGSHTDKNVMLCR